MSKKKQANKRPQPNESIWVDGWSAVREYCQKQSNWIEEIQILESVPQDHAVFKYKGKIKAKRVPQDGWEGRKSLVRALIRHSVKNELALAEIKTGALVLVFDGIEDPRNFGAIARSAAFLGVKDLVYRSRRQVSISSGSLATAQGAFAHLNLIEVPNITRAIKKLKNRGFWVLGACLEGEDIESVSKKFDGDSKALVLGSEATGISRLVLEQCDVQTTIPRRCSLDSLNVSAAATVLLYELNRKHAVEIS